MSKNKKKPSDRILAATLSVALTTCFTPVSVYAEGVQTTTIQSSTNSTETKTSTQVTSSESSTASSSIVNETETLVLTDLNENDDKGNLEYTFEISGIEEQDKGNIRIWINGQDGFNSNVKLKVGDRFRLKLELQNDNKNYRICSAKIGSKDIFSESVAGKTVYEEEVIFTQEMADTANGDRVSIDIAIAQTYQVKFTYNSENGSVEPSKEYSAVDDKNPSLTVGTVSVNFDSEIGFSAKPNENYRVAEVKIDGQSFTYEENDRSVSNDEYVIEKNVDHSIEVMFMLNTYTVTVSGEVQNGSVEVSNGKIEYGSNSEIKITPDEGYFVSSILLDGEKVPAENVSNNVLRIEHIDSDHEVCAEFEKIFDASESDFTWNFGTAIENEGSSFVFSQGNSVIFSTDKLGIQLIGDNNNILSGNESSTEAVINSDSVIKAVKLYYQDSEYVNPSWHECVLKTPINISFYVGVKAKLELPELDEGRTAYNSDVTLTLDIDVPNENYPAVSKIEYWIDGDDERIELEDVEQREITISAADYNRDNIKVNALIVDADNHPTYTSSKVFSINTTVPTVDVAIDGTLLVGAEEGYYSEARTATVTIHDKNYTFNKDVSAFSIYKNGNELSDSEKNEMITWSESPNVLIATVCFKDDAEYSWSIKYTNSAGVYNEGITKETGESIYSFWVDNSSPEAKIKTSEGVWDELLNVLSFNIYKPSSISVSVEGMDGLSGVKEIKYYKDLYSSNLKNISEPTKLFSTLENLYSAEESPFELYTGTFKINPQEKAVIYVRIMDKAGRVTYISSDGLIVDNKAPQVIKLSSDADKSKPSQNGRVTYSVDVDDVFVDGEAYSGIKEIKYVVSKDEKIIHQEILFNWDGKQLCDKWSGKFSLDPKDNQEYNQDGLKVEVFVTDNAGNTTSTNGNVSINVDELKVDIEFIDEEYNENRLKDNTFTSRSAKFIFSDRLSSFDQESAEVAIVAAITADKITSMDGSQSYETMPEDLFTIEWDKYDARVAIVTFNYCGNYTLKNDYTNNNTVYKNLAGNKVHVIDNPIEFTIDDVAPTGRLTIEENAWDELLSVLTFGIYSSNDFKGYIDAEDMTSETKIEYFVSHDTSSLMNKVELDNITEWTEFTQAFVINDPENYVIYARITDYAGNYTYICSDGHIIDKSAPVITLTPEREIKTSIFKNDANEEITKYWYNASNKNGIKVELSVTELEPYAGLKTVRYWVEADNEITQEDELYSFTETAPAYGDLRSRFETTINVDPTINNSSNVVLYVEAVDNAGNATVSKIYMDIDITAPTVTVSYNNNFDNAGNSYFDKTRTATISITERSNHFNSDIAAKGIKITAVDVNGQNVENAYTVSNWTTTKGKTPDQDYHVATISYTKDANFTFEISYTDEAENANAPVLTGSSVAPYKFTVDTTPPTGSLTALSAEGRELRWETLIDSLSFGFWSNTNINISGTSDDKTSPVASVDYYKVASINANDATVALTKNQLDAVTTWKPFTGFDVKPNEQFTVYLRIIDMAGNTTYISSNGLIVDDNAPHEEFTAPEIKITPEQSESGIYNSDVKIAINVDDPLVGGTYSGLKNIRYRVLNMGIETQSGTLYEFSSDNPLQSDLLKSWNGEITVNSNLNNSNDVKIEVFAEDNALNGSSKDLTIKIDITSPSINVAYSNNTSNGNLYKDPRTAQISVRERNFDGKYFNVLKNGERVDLSWSSSGGSGNGDDTLWYAELPFTADGDYTFGISGTDLASNKNSEVEFGNSTHPTEFTIDGTNPVINVEFIEGENPHENNYYQKPRTAQITIDELHFDRTAASDGVKCSVVVDKHDSKGNTTSSTVELSDWSQVPNSNKYVATMKFENDAQYSFNVNYTDQAGNEGQSYTTAFYVDTLDPSLTISANGSEKRGAYSGKIEAIINYDDTNYDSSNVEISMTGVNVEVTDSKIYGNDFTFTLKNKSGETIEWNGHFVDVTEEGSSKVYGKKVTFDNFPEGAKLKEFDDIYTVTVSLTDKSGRKTAKQLVFSVNRFGSTYDISRVSDILGTYSKNSPSIVVSEINPDELTEYTITLFKNNETITLNKGTDYEVEVIGGENEWHEYVYTIPAANFTDDGIYSLTFHSVDKANNISENTLDTKESEISFAVDTTPPKAMVANIESGKTYAEDSRRVIMTADDNILLSHISVYLDNDNQVYKEWSASEISEILGKNNEEEREFSFDINGDSTRAHTLKIVCTDAAGNETELSFNGFYVTTNMWIRFINNKPALFGTIGGLLAAIGGSIFVIGKKRKRS